MAVRVLIADSSGIARNSLRYLLELGGCKVPAEAENTWQAVNFFRAIQPEIVAMDMGLSTVDGIDPMALFKTIRDESPKTSIIVLAPDCGSIDRNAMLAQGALEVIEAPVDRAGVERMWRRLSAVYPELRRADGAATN